MAPFAIFFKGFVFHFKPINHQLSLSNQKIYTANDLQVFFL